MTVSDRLFISGGCAFMIISLIQKWKFMKRQKRESEKRCLCQWVPLLFNSQVATTQIYEQRTKLYKNLFK